MKLSRKCRKTLSLCLLFALSAAVSALLVLYGKTEIEDNKLYSGDERYRVGRFAVIADTCLVVGLWFTILYFMDCNSNCAKGFCKVMIGLSIFGSIVSSIFSFGENCAFGDPPCYRTMTPLYVIVMVIIGVTGLALILTVIQICCCRSRFLCFDNDFLKDTREEVEMTPQPQLAEDEMV
jgi:hypothetical protein